VSIIERSSVGEEALEFSDDLFLERDATAGQSTPGPAD
jgi:hypothetical protein